MTGYTSNSDLHLLLEVAKGRCLSTNGYMATKRRTAGVDARCSEQCDVTVFGGHNRRGCSTGVQGPKDGSVPILLRNLSYFSASPVTRSSSFHNIRDGHQKYMFSFSPKIA